MEGGDRPLAARVRQDKRCRLAGCLTFSAGDKPTPGLIMDIAPASKFDYCISPRQLPFHYVIFSRRVLAMTGMDGG